MQVELPLSESDLRTLRRALEGSITSMTSGVGTLEELKNLEKLGLLSASRTPTSGGFYFRLTDAGVVLLQLLENDSKAASETMCLTLVGVRQGHSFIDLVKTVRAAMGISLKEAKELVDTAWAGKPVTLEFRCASHLAHYRAQIEAYGAIFS